METSIFFRFDNWLAVGLRRVALALVIVVSSLGGAFGFGPSSALAGCHIVGTSPYAAVTGYGYFNVTDAGCIQTSSGDQFRSCLRKQRNNFPDLRFACSGWQYNRTSGSAYVYGACQGYGKYRTRAELQDNGWNYYGESAWVYRC